MGAAWCSWPGGCPGTPPNPPCAPTRWDGIGPEWTMHVGQMSPPCKAWKGSGREPGQRAIPPFCSHVTELSSDLSLCPSGASSPPAIALVALCLAAAGPVEAAAPQTAVSSGMQWQRDATAKHPSCLPPLCNPSPEFSTSGAAASHPAVWDPAAASPLLCLCILPIAASGRSPPF